MRICICGEYSDFSKRSGGTPILTGAGMLVVPLSSPALAPFFLRSSLPRSAAKSEEKTGQELDYLGLKSLVLVPLRMFKAKYLHLHTTRYLLGAPRSIEGHFI